MARIGTKFKFCKKHNEKTEHGVYQYGDEVAERCLKCAKDQGAVRRSDPEKYAHDKAYNKQWARKNPGYAKEQSQLFQLKKRMQKKLSVNDFLVEHYGFIKVALERFESSLTLKDVSRHCHRFGVTSPMKVIEFIKNNKFSQLKDQEAWKASTIVKYRYGVRKNYAELSEAYKEIIRAEYKTIAIKNAMAKMADLCRIP